MFEYNSIPEALEALRNGEIIMVTDDEDRENEGDFICAAEFATTDNINFMATHAKGLICMPMSEEFVKKLQIPQMVTETPTTTKRRSRSRSTTWIPLRASPMKSAVLLRARWSTKIRSRPIFACL